MGPRTQGDAASRRRVLATVALTAAVTATITVGVGAYGLLASLDVTSLDPLTAPLRWGSLAIIGVFVGALAIVVGVAALFRSQRALGSVAIVMAVVMPVAAGAVGLQLGAMRLHANLTEEASEATTAALATLHEAIDYLGPIGVPISDWLDAQFEE